MIATPSVPSHFTRYRTSLIKDKENIFDASTSNYSRACSPPPHLPLNDKPSQTSPARFTQILQRVQASAELNVARTVAECKGDLSEAIKSLGSSLGIMVKTDFIDLDGKNSPRKSKGSRQRFYHLDEASTSEETIRGYPDVSTLKMRTPPQAPAKTEPDWFESLREWEQAGSGGPKTSWDEEDDDYSDSLVLSTPPCSSESPPQKSGLSSHADILDPENAFWSGTLSSTGPSNEAEADKYQERPSSRQGFFMSE